MRRPCMGGRSTRVAQHKGAEAVDCRENHQTRGGTVSAAEKAQDGDAEAGEGGGGTRRGVEWSEEWEE